MLQPTGQQQNWKPGSLKKVEVLRELLARRTAQTGLIPFTEYTFPRYRTARHHRLIAEQLERVERVKPTGLCCRGTARANSPALDGDTWAKLYLNQTDLKSAVSGEKAKVTTGDVEEAAAVLDLFDKFKPARNVTVRSLNLHD
jgi:hypothetical protein